MLRKTAVEEGKGGLGQINSICTVLLTEACGKKFEKMATLVKENLSKAQNAQKIWYDKSGQANVGFQAGDYVMVLLPTSTSKFTAQWQGPYQVLKAVGEVKLFGWT